MRDIVNCFVRVNIEDDVYVQSEKSNTSTELVLDEFFEVLTWRQIGLHDKPIVLCNIGGYWDPLVALLDHIIDQGFADPSITSFMSVSPTVKDTMASLESALS